MHKAESILDAIKAKMQGLVSAGVVKQVVSSMAEPPTSYPALIVSMGDDTPTTKTFSHTQSDLNVTIAIVATANTPDLDNLTLSIRAEIHKALMLDETQGLGFVSSTNFITQREPDYRGDADTYICVTRLLWAVNYRFNTRDPSL